MSTAAPRRRYTLADYLDVEERSPTVKHELVAGEIFAMAGGSVEHSALATAFTGLLLAHLRGTPCRPHGSDLRIAITPANAYTYADAAVVCDPVERAPHSPSHVTNPRVVMEVLSPSTEAYDRGEKLRHYKAIPSLREVVLVDHRERLAVIHRKEDDGTWTRHEAGPGAALRLMSLDCDLPVDEVYRDGLTSMPP